MRWSLSLCLVPWMAAILPCFMPPMSQSPSSSPRKGTGVQRGCCTLIDGEHLEVAVCQCDGGVPGPRHSAAGEEGGASPATLTAHVFFGQRPCCLGVLLRRCCVSVWWWGAWSSTQRRRGRERGGLGITSNTHRSLCLGPWMVFMLRRVIYRRSLRRARVVRWAMENT